DQIPFRDEFIGVKTQSEYLVGKRDTNNVFFGKDDYLIEKHSGVSSDVLERNYKYLENFLNKSKEMLGENHASAIIVPTASNILTDKLPAFATDFNQNILLDRMDFDARVPLNTHNQEYIYYKTDHHWTTLGAYYTYMDWADYMGITPYDDYKKEMVSDKFYGTLYSKARLVSTTADEMWRYIPNNNAEYTVTYNLGERVENTLYNPEKLEVRDKYSYFLNGNNPVVEIKSNNDKQGKLLIVKDSFAHSFAPFAVNDFAQVDMIDLRYLNYSVVDYIKEHEITDVLVLYSSVNFAKESNLFKLDMNNK
ncbi:MAG: DHHW family protein, partial [Oscillospiraceae bacterium]